MGKILKNQGGQGNCTPALLPLYLTFLEFCWPFLEKKILPKIDIQLKHIINKRKTGIDVNDTIIAKSNKESDFLKLIIK